MQIKTEIEKKYSCKTDDIDLTYYTDKDLIINGISGYCRIDNENIKVLRDFLNHIFESE